MKIGIGSDHGGYNLKREIIDFLKKREYEVIDFGTYGTDSVDYPDFGLKVAEAVKGGECDRGIVVCGTGVGISISANKVPGIRAAVCTNSYMARMSREHNDANILALGERVVGLDLALDIVDTWLKAEFQGGRHSARVGKIGEIEEKYSK
ncbi:ribose 5-phosphate isomerase B [Acetivibrio straminisolvens]|jgi:ribose 5-phosphate isomerase B|uniref:Ribose 5-phosphate isomerase B n=1 Tax=Acetivibrio straminisolvens JCM 21531 TaxID=1294263 RepID=W4V2C8_9FIRM|nr:ribose 5-phosphate isomerase B [Acetivibrio straminisolvens]GAE87287.1 ribose 5-phosphate isomerase B [Acetivibrio straminisolvens JCM 21531]